MTCSLKFISLKIFNQNFLLGLELQELQKQAQEFGGTLIAIDPPNTAEVDSLVNKRLS